jgi:branched-chain amino acid transport system substrate-binding protein
VVRRLLVVVSALSLLTVAACGSGSGSGSGGSGKDKTVTVGYMANLTGAAGGEYGTPFSRGLQMGLNEVKSSGYLKNRGLSVDLQTTDVASLVPNAVTAFNKFAQAGVPITISDSLSPISLAVAPLANNKKVTLISGAGSKLPNPDGYAFHLVDLVTPMRSLGKQMQADGVKRVAVILDGDNPSFKTLADAMTEGFTSAGGVAPVITQTISASATDVSSVLTNVSAQHPDAVFISSLPQQAGNVVAQLKQVQGLSSAKLYGSISWGAQTYEIAKKDVVGAVFAQEWAPGATATAEFEKAYQSKYGDTPAAYSALGYQTAWLIAVAINQAAGKGAVNGTTIRDNVPSASTSSDLKEHGVMPEFAIAKDGATSYTGTLTTFTSTGALTKTQ